MKYPIGMKFKTRHKSPRLCTIVDIHKTYNSKGELVRSVYVTEHEFMGQVVREQNVVQTTIDMGLMEHGPQD